MVRKSLWIGLRLGILAGIVFAVVKTVQARRAGREPIAPPEAWRPPERTEPAAEREAPPREVPRREAPTRPGPPRPAQPPMPPRPSVTGPPQTAAPEPEPEPEPVAKAAPPAKKAAAKKAAKKARKATKAAKKAATKAAEPARAWVEASEGACPQSHPVKAKLSSKIFHLPGMFAYDRTNPDRCYADAEAATNDGFRAAKR